MREAIGIFRRLPHCFAMIRKVGRSGRSGIRSVSRAKAILNANGDITHMTVVIHAAVLNLMWYFFEVVKEKRTFRMVVTAGSLALSIDMSFVRSLHPSGGEAWELSLSLKVESSSDMDDADDADDGDDASVVESLLHVRFLSKASRSPSEAEARRSLPERIVGSDGFADFRSVGELLHILLKVLKLIVFSMLWTLVTGLKSEAPDTGWITVSGRSLLVNSVGHSASSFGASSISHFDKGTKIVSDFRRLSIRLLAD